MKNKIIEILKKHPNGLKARQIAALLPNADRRKVNQILYDSQTDFEISKDYVWKLKSTSVRNGLENINIQTIVENAPKDYAGKKKATEPVPRKATPRSFSSNSASTSTRLDTARRSWEERRKREEEERERQRQARQQDPKWQEEKQRLHEQQLRYEKEKSRYRLTSKPSSEPVRACVGDCSTCTKDECIMDKLRK